MNNYKQVDAFVAEWKNAGLSKEKIIVNCAEAELGWAYVWGAVGAQCTPSQRQSYANSKYVAVRKTMLFFTLPYLIRKLLCERRR